MSEDFLRLLEQIFQSSAFRPSLCINLSNCLIPLRRRNELLCLSLNIFLIRLCLCVLCPSLRFNPIFLPNNIIHVYVKPCSKKILLRFRYKKAPRELPRGKFLSLTFEIDPRDNGNADDYERRAKFMTDFKEIFPIIAEQNAAPYD